MAHTHNGLEDLFFALVNQLSNEIDEFTTQLVNKVIDVPTWRDSILSSIFEANKKASAYGRGSKEVKFDDIKNAEYFTQEQSQFLNEFANQIIEGDPEYINDKGEYLQEAILNRVHLYSKSIRITSIKSWLSVQKSDEEFYWVVTARESCVDCPYVAEGSPYTKQTLYLLPGDGTTECKMNCKCYLRNSSGQRCFKAV